MLMAPSLTPKFKCVFSKRDVVCSLSRSEQLLLLDQSMLSERTHFNPNPTHSKKKEPDGQCCVVHKLNLSFALYQRHAKN
jgi:hypothetical protein